MVSVADVVVVHCDTESITYIHQGLLKHIFVNLELV